MAKTTKRTRLSRLLREILNDDAEDLAVIVADLRTWAERLDLRAASRWSDFGRPSRSGRPRSGAPRSFLDDADPVFLSSLVRHCTEIVKAGRRFARTKRNPATFRAEIAPGKVLLGGFYSPNEEHAQMFRQRFADVVSDRSTRPRVAGAQLALWYGGASDSVEEAGRLLERLKKQGKTPAR